MAEEKKEETPKEEKPEVKEEEKEEKKEEESKEEPKKEEKPKEEAKKEESEEVEVPDKFKDIVEKVEGMNVMDLAELVKILEKKFGVSASAPVAAAPAAAAPGEEAEEKSEFNVVLSSIGDKKIEVIKAVRDITQKGLKDAKDLVDAASSEPQTIKEGVKKEEAEEMKKKFEEAGAKAELK